MLFLQGGASLQFSMVPMNLLPRELDATGERAHRPGAGYLDVLTAQEIQIARLLSGGRTTKETAATLFLSPKTVEYHLRHVYQKLGINSRGDLAAALAADPEVGAG